MSRCVIFLSSHAGGACPNYVGRYIKSYDPEANDDGGEPVVTEKRSEAMTFDDVQKAIDFWNTRPARAPTRPDGQPNRPLRAFSINVMLAEGSNAEAPTWE